MLKSFSLIKSATSGARASRTEARPQRAHLSIDTFAASGRFVRAHERHFVAAQLPLVCLKSARRDERRSIKSERAMRSARLSPSRKLKALEISETGRH